MRDRANPGLNILPEAMLMSRITPLFLEKFQQIILLVHPQTEAVTKYR